MTCICLDCILPLNAQFSEAGITFNSRTTSVVTGGRQTFSTGERTLLSPQQISILKSFNLTARENQLDKIITYDRKDGSQSRAYQAAKTGTYAS